MIGGHGPLPFHNVDQAAHTLSDEELSHGVEIITAHLIGVVKRTGHNRPARANGWTERELQIAFRLACLQRETNRRLQG